MPKTDTDRKEREEKVNLKEKNLKSGQFQFLLSGLLKLQNTC
jgi:hypothetical protein